MELSYTTIQAILERQLDQYDHCHEYGEPGYDFRHDATTPIAVFASYWCPPSCADERFDGFHAITDHHPRVWQQMEDQGVEFEWYDEWYVDYDNAKAYRTTADSYMWQSSIQYSEDHDGYLTPDDDIEEWIGWARNSKTRALVARYLPALEAAGFVRADDERYETGWHEHMDADPAAIFDRLRKFTDDDIVFVIDETSQFYITWSAWTRPTEEE